jgi:hypothetical protein
MRALAVLGGVALLGLPLWAKAVPDHNVGVPALRAPVRLAIPGRANATPSLAARGDFVAVAWGATAPEGGADVFVAVSRDSGQTFGPPVPLDTARPRQARLGGEMPPRVALGPAAPGADPAIHVVWGARTSLSESTITEIRMAKSVDGGKSFEPPTRVTSEGVPGDRGWHATTVDSHGTPHTLWLDHRAIPPRKPGEKHVHGQGPDMSTMSGLYYAGAGTNGLERELTRGVCYCCKTALAVSERGQVYAAWRQVYDGSMRDIAFTMSLDNGKTFQTPARVSVDNWKLSGCPDDGPSLALADGRAHIVWPTVIGGDNPEGALFYASTLDGRKFTPRLRIPTMGTPKPSHPQVAADGAGGLVVAWDEVVDGARQAAARRVSFDAKGVASFGEIVKLGTDISSFPVMAMTSQGMIATWTRGIGPSAEVVVDLINVLPTTRE